MKDETAEEIAKIIIGVKVTAEVEIGTGLGKDHFLDTLVMIETIGVKAIVGPGQDQGQVQIERESDLTSVGNMIIPQDFPTSREERELEQLHQMFNLDGEQASLKSLATNTHGNFNKINSEEDLRMGHLNV